MKKIFAILLSLIFVVSLCSCSSDDDKIRFGAAGIGGIYNETVTSIRQLADESGKLKIEQKTTAGSAANVRLLSQGYLDAAIAQSDIVSDAYNGENNFEKSGAYKGYSALASLYTEACHIVVRKDSNINSVDDLLGKTVSIGEKESGSELNAKQILASYGLNSKMVKEVNLDYAEAAKKLENKEIDCLFVTVGMNATIVDELAKQCDIKLLEIDNATSNKLKSAYSYIDCKIPKNTYNGQNTDINTIGIKSVILVNDKLSNDKVKELAKLIFNNAKEIQLTVSADIDITEENAVKGINIPFHKGNFLKKKISFLQRFCIPSPVIGGLLFAIFTLILYATGIAVIDFDDTLKEVCMVLFFTSVGFQANLKVLKSGGKALIVFLVLVVALMIGQNFASIGLANVLGLDSLTGMTTGSIPMIGGHGTAGAFGPVLEDFGVSGATTVCTAAATFGLIAGSLMGGPIGNRLIKKHNLLDTIKAEDDSFLVEEEEKHERHFSMYAPAVFQLIIAVGIGTIVSELLSLTGMTFPIYIGAMIVAAIMRNIGEYTGKITIHMGEINDLGGICLSLFLGIAMITLKLWQLADLALPLVILLAGQSVLMFLFAYYVVYNIMGRDYDAAVIAAGTCGFGMGATPNAMANMQAICDKYAPSVKAYLIIPIVGSLFADFLNSLTITFFINLL